jgi:hypothetical protein
MSNRPSLLRVAAVFLVTVIACFAAGTASAESEEELAAKRTHWQEKYRTLRYDKVRLETDIETLTNAYALAQRRNFPRGGARDKLVVQAAEAKKQLAETEEALASIHDEARRAGIPPGWLYEVETEPVESSQPASPGAGEDAEDRAGRNPLYFDDQEAGDAP